MTLSVAFAQLQGKEKIDSLLKEIPNIKEDTNGVNLLKDLSFYFYSINPELGIEYGNQGLELSKKIDWDLGLAKCYNSLGVVYSFGKSNYSKALECYLKALNINEKLGTKFGIADNLGNIGIIYNELKNNTKALEYYFKALDLNKIIANKYGIANNLGNIANIYEEQSNYSKALEYYQKVLDIYKHSGNKSNIASCFQKIGIIYSNLKDYQKSLEYLNKSLNINSEINDKLGLAYDYGNIGQYYLTIANDLEYLYKDNGLDPYFNREIYIINSIQNIEKAIELFKEIGEINSQKHFLIKLSEAYELKEDYKNAFEVYKESKILNDSIFSSDNQTTIANLEAKRENELKEKEIEILKVEKENQKLQRYAMFGGITGLGIIIGLILIQRRKSEKLILNVLPSKIAKRLKAEEHPIADHFDGASIIFIDLVGFTKMSSSANPKEIVALLNDIFTVFDKLADRHGLEKIKTIGDAYMAVAGIPEIQADHAKRTAQMALDIKLEMKDFKTSNGTEIKFRIGIDCGAVVAGVIGEKKFIYDLWSDAVNTASRMESTGESGLIQITENFKNELEKFEGNWNFTLRGEFEVKGKGLMKTYFLEN